MNLISKSGCLASNLRGATRIVANNVEITPAVNGAAELSVPKKFDVIINRSNNSLAARNSVVGGGEYHANSSRIFECA